MAWSPTESARLPLPELAFTTNAAWIAIYRSAARSPGDAYDVDVRTPIRNPPDPMYTEFEVHRTMICDRVRTDAFRRAIESVVRPGDIVLDVGAGSGILSVFAARAGARRVYAVERTSVAVLAQELAAANGVGDVVQFGVCNPSVRKFAIPNWATVPMRP